MDNLLEQILPAVCVFFFFFFENGSLSWHCILFYAVHLLREFKEEIRPIVLHSSSIEGPISSFEALKEHTT